MAVSFVSLHFRLRNLALVTRLAQLFLSFESQAKPFGQKLLDFGQPTLMKSLSEGQLDNNIFLWLLWICFLITFNYFFLIDLSTKNQTTSRWLQILRWVVLENFFFFLFLFFFFRLVQKQSMFFSIGVLAKSFQKENQFNPNYSLRKSWHFVTSPLVPLWNDIWGQEQVLGMVQGVCTTRFPPEMTCGFLIQLDICQKKKNLSLWFIGVEVKQETGLKNLC